MNDKMIEKLVKQYEDECEAGEYDYLDTEHLYTFLKNIFIKYKKELTDN